MERSPDYVDGVADMLESAECVDFGEVVAGHAMPTGARRGMALGNGMTAEVIVLLREYASELHSSSAPGGCACE